MKYTVTASGENIRVENIEISEVEKADLKTAVENMAQATAAAMLEFSRSLAEEAGQEKLIFDAIVQCIQFISGDFSKREKNIFADHPYEDMESEFLTWIYRQGYDDPFAFADEHRGRQLKLDFDADINDVEVFFSDGNGEKYDIIGEIPSYLFTDEPGMAAAYCAEYTSIAVLALDKLYGRENNSLRGRPPSDLENRIKNRLGID